MFHRTLISVLVLLSFLECSNACPDENDKGYVRVPAAGYDANHNLTRRWNSLATGLGKDAKPSTWPALPDKDGKVDEFKRYVRYCFVSEEAANNLLDIVAHAIARWQPVTLYSSLDIVPESHCQGENPKDRYRCICNADSGNALQIRDGSQEVDKGLKRTRFGYLASKSSAVLNTMIFDYEPAGKGEVQRQEAIRAATHELGHSIGLIHEHQRIDRSDYVVFNCKKLAGYDEATSRVAKDTKVFDREQTLDDRMKSICTKYNLAKEFFPIATQFMRRTLKEPTERSKEWFDYGSMMIYSSFTKDQESPPYEEWRLVRRPAADKRPIYMGGVPEADKAAISVQDILRVAALYPGGAEKEAKLQELEKDQGWDPLPVKWDDLVTTTVVSVPTDVAAVNPRG